MTMICWGILTATLLMVSLPCIQSKNHTSLYRCPDEVSALCPPTPGEQPEYFAHPNNCAMFCECGLRGVAWELVCQSSLLWDDTIKSGLWITAYSLNVRDSVKAPQAPFSPLPPDKQVVVDRSLK
ncbi:putative Chitin binding Peritrophin-A domain-containing protein 21 [Homarus americanus]|uniref:Putative Chitin binding Peritrophin-A domain-containing protein 21 n=1 Tax=Homarus americanus TaxID=6706 RepID=A0A8J5JUI9_HOMAM|nr:putative Chitin binding Peritrophin-A domain-containing protein 21 [Homarus americanus]